MSLLLSQLHGAVVSLNTNSLLAGSPTDTPFQDCKSLAPTWESLAEDFAAEPTVVIAKIDAEAENSKATAKEQGVTSYPTIKFFPKGSKTPIPYEGGRAEEHLVGFVNDMARTHRSVGGGLDAKAGTIDTLDTILAKLSTGATVASISEELASAAAAAKDKYAEYYAKVAKKMSASQGYAQKELKRLEGILKKGGLARSKQDDLRARSNILRKFVGDVQDKIKEVKEEL
jgi:protein disulfide-isomerase A6